MIPTTQENKAPDLSTLDFRVERLTQESLDMDALTRTLSESLWNDPFSVFLYPDDTSRKELFTTFIKSFVQCGLKDGHVYAMINDQNEYMGGAVWVGPEKPVVKIVPFVVNTMANLPLLSALSFSVLYKLTLFGDVAEKLHRFEQKPHYYLLTLGLAPNFQGLGLGRHLLAPILEKADRKGINCYLESTNPLNYSFYFRSGFTVAHDVTPKQGPRICAMRRRP